MSSILEQTGQWDLAEHRPLGQNSSVVTFSGLLKQLEYFARKEFRRFVPALHPPHSPAYRERLEGWLANDLSDGQRRVLFEFALRLAFFSHDDFQQLYRAAYAGPVTRWVIDREALKLNTPDFQQRLEAERHDHTWFCPITDSMGISDFYHANAIGGTVHRPAFKPLVTFGDHARIRAHMSGYRRNEQMCPLKRLVLLEDFVGSGRQTRPVVKWAVEKLEAEVLFAPLIICPRGAAVMRDLAAEFSPRLRFDPVLELKPSDMLGPERQGGDDLLVAAVEALAVDSYAKVAAENAHDYDLRPNGPFGWEQTGAPVVLFSNTPNNTPPLVHYQSATWKPLFPRVIRN